MQEIIGYFWSRSETAECAPCALRTIRNRPRPQPFPTQRNADPGADDTDREESEDDTPNAMHDGEIGWGDGIRCDTCGMRIGWPDMRPTTFEDLWSRRRRARADAHTAERAAEADGR